MRDLRPIALCNVLYKIIAKVLANRLKSVLPNLISECQAAFLQGRSIHDNIVAAFELIHAMKRNTKKKKGNVALKIDISKAFDRLRWDFVQAMLERMGFGVRFVGWIMHCITTVKYHICLNGELFGPITPGRGLRQGDPLSPYLFILCSEGLSALLRRAERNSLIHGLRICRQAPPVTHLRTTVFFFSLPH